MSKASWNNTSITFSSVFLGICYNRWTNMQLASESDICPSPDWPRFHNTPRDWRQQCHLLASAATWEETDQTVIPVAYTKLLRCLHRYDSCKHGLPQSICNYVSWAQMFHISELFRLQCLHCREYSQATYNHSWSRDLPMSAAMWRLQYPCL